jgi:phosphohistidine phosphatase
MRLYVLQHGDAVPEADDPDRPLSPRGRQDMERLRDLLASRGHRVERVLHSGKTRALQSAELVAQGVLSSGAAQATAGLRPKDDPANFIDRLPVLGSDLLIASHMPFVGQLVAALVTGNAGAQCVAFSPGTLVVLAGEPGAGWLIELVLPPGLLG